MADSPKKKSAKGGRKRIRRQDPERTAPRRNPGGAFRQGPEAGSVATGGAEAWRDVIERGVRLGYQVVQEQLDFGRRVAGQMGDSGPRAGDDRLDLERLGGNMFSAMAEMSTRFLEMMGSMTSRPGAAAGIGSSVLSIRVDASVPVEILLDLVAPASGNGFVVRPLYSEVSGSAPLENARLEQTQGGVLSVLLEVPRGQPAGVYEGNVLDARTGRSVGRLVATVGRRGTRRGSARKGSQKRKPAKKTRATQSRKR